MSIQGALPIASVQFEKKGMFVCSTLTKDFYTNGHKTFTTGYLQEAESRESSRTERMTNSLQQIATQYFKHVSQQEMER